MWNSSQQKWRRTNRIYKIFSLYRWFRCWSIWWKCPWASLASNWCYYIIKTDVLEDLWNAIDKGEKQYNFILEKQVFSKEFSLKARLTKSKRLNYAITPISKIKTCSNEVEMDRNALVIVIDSVEKNDVITLESLIVKRISKECLLCLTQMFLWEKRKLIQSFSRRPLVLWSYFSICHPCWYRAYLEICILIIWWLWCKYTQRDRLRMA